LTAPVRILLVDDSPIVRRAFRAALTAASGFDVVEDAADTFGAIEATARLDPDIILLDVCMPRLDGIQCLRVLLVQHMSEGFDAGFVAWLGSVLHLNVVTAQDFVMPRSGLVYVAPNDSHITVDQRGRLRLDSSGPEVCGHRPSGRVLLGSIVESLRADAVGVVLNGMGDDGAAGLLKMREAGAMTLPQDRGSSTVDGMPRAARSLGAAERVGDPPALSRHLMSVGKRVRDRRLPMSRP
jgi:chemotaxis response regulator CheB